MELNQLNSRISFPMMEQLAANYHDEEEVFYNVILLSLELLDVDKFHLSVSSCYSSSKNPRAKKDSFFKQETVFETEFQAKKTQQGVKDQNPLTKKKGGFCGFIFRDLIDERINLGG